MKPRKTYWHLGQDRRKPSRYEIVSTRLLRHPERGLEVTLPFGKWYDRYLRGSPLTCPDWDAFRDPRETTYASYTKVQSRRASHVDALFAAIEGQRALAEPQRELLGSVVAPLLHLLHGLHMVTAYLGQLAPSGTIAIALTFQAADEMRRIECLARRIDLARDHDPELGDDRRTRWEQDAVWQPVRRMIEELLVTYDWGEAFAGLQLAVKPLFDRWATRVLAGRSKGAGDTEFARILNSLEEDARWHADWSAALAGMLVEKHPDNASVLAAWTERWHARTATSLEALAPLLDAGIATGGIA